MNLYVVKRQKRPKHMRDDLAWHQTLVCTRKHTAQWEAGWSGDGSWVWSAEATQQHAPGGWLLTRWDGLDIDYGHVVREYRCPDGTPGAFWRHHDTDDDCGDIRPVLNGAVWWSPDHRLPDWLTSFGVVLATDAFSINNIVDDAGMYMLGPEAEHKLDQRREERGYGEYDHD